MDIWCDANLILPFIEKNRSTDESRLIVRNPEDTSSTSNIENVLKMKTISSNEKK